MAAPTNTTTASDINFALDKEFLKNYNQEFDRLNSIINFIGGVETYPAGTALYQYEVTGTLNNEAGSDSSSGTAYVEGDLVALSKYAVDKKPIDAIAAVPYRKVTTAAAVLKSGVEAAVFRTDAKMLSQIRNQDITNFFGYLANGTGTATGSTLQEAFANVDATLGDALETNGDEGGQLIHFVNRMDAAAYLGTATITTQAVYGMTYLENFLGVERVFLTNKVASGTMYATTTENLHAYGLDFAELSRGGLTYAQQDSGLIAVSHAPLYDHVSIETNVLSGLLIIPEVLDYIVKGTIGTTASA